MDIIQDDNTIQTKQLETSPPVTIEHVEGRSSNPAEISCHHMEHSSRNVKSSEDSRESREKVVTPVVLEIQDNFEHHEGESSSATRIIMNSDDAQEVSPTQTEALHRIPFVQSSTLSPKSVLQPSFLVDLGSTASFDQYIDQEQLVRNNVEILSPAGYENSSPALEHPLALPSSDGNVRDVEISQESAESSTSHVETGNTDSINEPKSHENGVKPEEVTKDSSHTLSMEEALPDQFKLIKDSGSICFNNQDEIPGKSFEVANPTAYSGEMDHANNSDSLRGIF